MFVAAVAVEAEAEAKLLPAKLVFLAQSERTHLLEPTIVSVQSVRSTTTTTTEARSSEQTRKSSARIKLRSNTRLNSQLWPSINHRPAFCALLAARQLNLSLSVCALCATLCIRQVTVIECSAQFSVLVVRVCECHLDKLGRKLSARAAKARL